MEPTEVTTPKTGFSIALPAWAGPMLEHAATERYTDAESRMGLALSLAERNVELATGGPFGAAVFDGVDGRLLGAAVNCVVPSGQSLAHAEVLALALAQGAEQSHDLSASRQEVFLSATASPCAMCLGALVWAGVTRLEFGARTGDVEAIGFDEGPRDRDWVTSLEARGISVQADVLRERANALLSLYRSAGGEVYNAGRQSGPNDA